MTLAHQLLIAEGVLSAVVMVLLAAWATRIEYIPEVFIISLTWNLAFLGLLVVGIEHNAWQYWVLGAYGAASLLAGIYNGVTRKIVPIEGRGGMVFFAVILLVGQTWLLVSAA